MKRFMRIISKTGDPKFAEVYVANVGDNPRSLIEFVDSVDPRFPREEKQVIIISAQIGCPVGCLMCDSGTYFHGNLTKDEMFAQIDHVLSQHTERGMQYASHPKFKVQFARMGEPSLNPAVLAALEEMPARYSIKGLMPCIATTAPVAAANWFRHLIDIKERLYHSGAFQLQFSLNSTDEAERDALMPVKKWKLEDIASYGELYLRKNDRKITLNFALTKDAEFESRVISETFDPEKFLIKITPVNPTDLATANNFDSVISHEEPNGADRLANTLEAYGFETIISIGVPEEIAIGSNCGQSARRILDGKSENTGQLETRPSL